MDTALFWCVKSIKRSADIRTCWKPLPDRPRHDCFCLQDTNRRLSIWKSTWHWKLNHEQTPVGNHSGLPLRHCSIDPPLKKKTIKSSDFLLCFASLYPNESLFRKTESECQHHYFFRYSHLHRERQNLQNMWSKCGDNCCVLLLRWSLLAWSWHYALHMGSVGTEAEARSKGQSLLQADL